MVGTIVEDGIPKSCCCLFSSFDTEPSEVVAELKKLANVYNNGADTHDHTISINQDYNIGIAILPLSATGATSVA
jgi:hypothetical protein